MTEATDNSGNQSINFTCEHGINQVLHANIGTPLLYKETQKTSPNNAFLHKPNSVAKSPVPEIEFSRGYTLQELEKDLDISYMKIYRRIKKLENEGFIKTDLAGGIILIYIPETIPKEEFFYIIKYPKSNLAQKYFTCNYISKHGKSVKSKNYYLQQAKNLFNHYKFLNEHGKASLQNYYTRYLNQNLDAKYLNMSISTSNRFNNPARALTQLNKAEKREKQLTSNGQPGLFLTLTTDPSKHETLMQANQNIKTAWNKFCREIRNIYGDFDYIKCNEFTKTGLPHIHAILFGLDYIHIKQISYLWSKCKQGKICYIQALTNDGENISWSRPLPNDVYHADIGSRTPGGYVIKNLSRMANDPYHPELAPYWVTGQQVISYSKLKTV